MVDEIQRVEELLRLAKQFQLSEMEWQEGGLRVLIRREGSPVAVAGELPSSSAGVVTAAVEVHDRSRLIELCAPMTGVFYRAPSPDAPPYVEVGDVVEEGQIICLIEAMKVFNEVPAEKSGRVVEVCAENGQLVEQGAAIFRLEPQEASA
ncbi:MAG: acetyl-CoA carboxylase [Armatimonadota bacterium]|nr:acetyl-CoA carboxylase [bacterium]MCS7309305.1 acetyl-CoA carboxylase [Armatimonadota bacterium]MDW8103998.1 acetyl-CoA carboxylase [Armatimonadota bacterium]MDW8290109.1 acetyl-CoA carboxylase [Armatimonadota bacterium]